MKRASTFFLTVTLLGSLSFFLLSGFSNPSSKNTKAASSGEISFTVRTVTQNGNYAPRHVFVIWVEDVNGFVKTRKAMANQRKQYLYTWKDASNYNVIDAITGPTLTSHQTHTVTWDCTDVDGEIVPDGDYVIWVEFTEKHAQGPLYTITFTKGQDPQTITPPDETYFKDIEFEFTPFVAEFTADVTDICQWEQVTFTDESVNATSWEWDFGEGAAPVTSTTQGPHSVYYTTPGPKTVSLTINGSLTETKENLISVSVIPEADFSFGGNGLTVEFTNNSANATSYLWDFGDGNTGTDNNPTHTYATAGTYTVTLTATYLYCEDDVSHDVMVPLTGIIESGYNNDFSIFPNPNNGIFNIKFENNFIPEKIQVFDHSGRNIFNLDSFESETSQISIDLHSVESSIYYLKIVSQGKSVTEKIIIK